MSCVHLHLGQAGNQIGKSFWGLAEEEFFADSGCSDRTRVGRAPASGTSIAPRLRPGGTAMFHEDGLARCLAVDSEPKVVHGFQERVKSLREENVIFSQSGLANNWAMGFASCRGDGSGGRDGSEGGLFDRVMEGMRKEAERSCWLNSVVMTHSLAGGTGSGFGSGLLQALRDDYPSLYLISACIGPFGAGDTPLQHYNSVLALHHLQAFADAVIYRGNDDLLLGAKDLARSDLPKLRPTAVRSRGGGGGGSGRREGWRHVGVTSRGGINSSRSITSSSRNNNNTPSRRQGGGVVSTTDMNESMSLDMGSCFFPTYRPIHLDPSATPPGGPCPRPPPRLPAAAGQGGEFPTEAVPRQFDAGSLVAAACPLPAAKFVDLRSTLSNGREASSLSSLGAAAIGEWGSLAGGLGRTAPLCPRKGGGRPDDVCVAAHHVVRGVIMGDTSAGGLAGARRAGGRGARPRRDVGGKVVVSTSDAVAAAAAAVGEASGGVSEVLRWHHECPEWRTATDVSCSPALRSREVARSISTVCNQTRIRGVFDGVLARAEEKFRARAYLHWYYRHGLEDEDFLAAFEGVRTVERGYDGLAKAFGGGGGGGGVHR